MIRFSFMPSPTAYFVHLIGKMRRLNTLTLPEINLSMTTTMGGGHIKFAGVICKEALSRLLMDCDMSMKKNILV